MSVLSEVGKSATKVINRMFGEPLVCAILLTKDRPAMAARAVLAFREQTYKRATLWIYHEDRSACEYVRLLVNKYGGNGDIDGHLCRGEASASIGVMRNRALQTAPSDADIFIHWDDDDVSHPNRIAEQVAHLQSSGADVAGYNELLFWRVTPQTLSTKEYGEAWLYKHRTHTPGTSLCYWRRTWERKPFPDLPKPGRGDAEDTHWLQGLNVAATSSLGHWLQGLNVAATSSLGHWLGAPNYSADPRLICSIHGGNTQAYDLEGIIARGSREWTRVPQWDEYARKVMAL
jgi:hypothetical protein